MRTLGIHSRGFRFESKEKAIQGAEAVAPGGHELSLDRECLVVFASVEKDDAKNPVSVAVQLATDTIKRAEQLGVRTVVLYPYVHLTEDPSTPRIALNVLDETESRLKDAGLEVVRAPFGWYKAFDLSCLGHPLSEWSGRYEPGGEVESPNKEKAERKPSEFVRWVIVDMDGSTHEVTPEDYDKCELFGKPEYALLKQFVSNELGRKVDTQDLPKHIEYMRRHELVDYCEVSEKGNLKWYPNGLLIQNLLLDYASQVSQEWGAFEMKNPLVIRGDHNLVGQLMGEFHERDYVVDGGRGTCYLRYASDPGAFPFMQNVRFTYKQTPLKVYEAATCFRNEQEGEVSGLKRVRNFMMTDMHAGCADVDQAKQEFELLCFRFSRLMDDIISKGRWVLGWEGTIGFFEENRDWLISIGKRMGVPAFFKLMPQMSHYYAIKNEYQSITEDKSNIQVSTVQWDVKDGERFNIGYIDAEGKKVPCPVIIHASSFGSIERTLCAILENIAIDAQQGIAPMFPVWLSPTQVRLLPVSDEYTPFAEEVCARLSAMNIRADVDDRTDTVGKKIRNGEQDWVPYLVVVGEKERESGRLSVRFREDKSQHEMPEQELADLIHEKTAGMPFRGLAMPRLISRRPTFYG